MHKCTSSKDWGMHPLLVSLVTYFVILSLWPIYGKKIIGKKLHSFAILFCKELFSFCYLCENPNLIVAKQIENKIDFLFHVTLRTEILLFKRNLWMRSQTFSNKLFSWLYMLKLGFALLLALLSKRCFQFRHVKDEIRW